MGRVSRQTDSVLRRLSDSEQSQGRAGYDARYDKS